jgi:hypothetical protein
MIMMSVTIKRLPDAVSKIKGSMPDAMSKIRGSMPVAMKTRD